MSDADNESAGFDIGIDARDTVSASSPEQRRTLPTWAFVVLALALGWMLGIVTSGAQTAEVPPVEPQPSIEPPSNAEISPSVEIDTGPTPGPEVALPEGSGHVTVVLLDAPLRGVAIPADLSVIERGVSTPVAVDLMISGANASWVGRGARRILVADQQVVFMALDAVMLFDPQRKSEPTEVATDAIHMLPGSNDSSVWLVGSGSRSVRHYSIANDELSETYDLSDVGAPLASFSGGLVIAPKDWTLGAFALWSPRRGIESLDLEEGFDFVDAGDNTLVLVGPQGLATYDVVTGGLSETETAIEPGQQRRAIVSPDGRRLAIVERGPVTELPQVTVIDTSTGETIDEFESAFEWQLQWVSADELLFAMPNGRAVKLNVRNTVAKKSEQIADLSSPNYLVTTVQEFEG